MSPAPPPSQDPSPNTPCPFLRGVWLSDLGVEAGLALWAFRMYALGLAERDCAAACLERSYTTHLGVGLGTQALRHMLVMVQLLGVHGSRTLRVATPCTNRITHDEASILALLEAAQAGRTHTVAAQSHWLMAGSRAAQLVELAEAVGAHFGAAGLRLATPFARPAEPPRAASAALPMPGGDVLLERLSTPGRACPLGSGARGGSASPGESPE